MKQRVRETLIVVAVAAYVEMRLRFGTLPTLADRLGITLDVKSGVVGKPGAVVPRWCVPSIMTTYRVLRYWPFGDTCLRRCLVLGQRLRGLDPVLRIGVRTTDAGQLEAHSWLEIDGKVLDASALDYLALASAGG